MSKTFKKPTGLGDKSSSSGAAGEKEWRSWQHTPVFLPGECHDRGAWDCEESDTTEVT